MLCQLCAALPDQLDGVSVSSLALFSIADFDALDPAVPRTTKYVLISWIEGANGPTRMDATNTLNSKVL